MLSGLFCAVFFPEQILHIFVFLWIYLYNKLGAREHKSFNFWSGIRYFFKSYPDRFLIFIDTRKIPIVNQFKIFSVPEFKESGSPNGNKEGVGEGKIIVENICKSNCRTAVIVGPIGTCLVTTENRFYLPDTEHICTFYRLLFCVGDFQPTHLDHVDTYLGHMV